MAGIVGLYDVGRVVDAPWIGVPGIEWPGFDLDFGPAFWSLLPVFLLLTPIVTLRTIGSCVAVQAVSWRNRRAVDYRAVQGAVNVDGLSNLLAGLAGTVPNNSNSVGASLTELTGGRGPAASGSRPGRSSSSSHSCPRRSPPSWRYPAPSAAAF